MAKKDVYGGKIVVWQQMMPIKEESVRHGQTRLEGLYSIGSDIAAPFDMKNVSRLCADSPQQRHKKQNAEG